MSNRNENAPQDANPFAADPIEDAFEVASGPTVTNSNVYAASDGEYRPVYETTLLPRPRIVARLGVAGFAFCLTGFLLSFAGVTRGLFLPFGLIGLIFAFVAVSIGVGDLSAMRAGAMHHDRRVSIRRSVVLGIIAIVLVVIRILAFIVADRFH